MSDIERREFLKYTGIAGFVLFAGRATYAASPINVQMVGQLEEETVAYMRAALAIARPTSTKIHTG